VSLDTNHPLLDCWLFPTSPVFFAPSQRVQTTCCWPPHSNHGHNQRRAQPPASCDEKRGKKKDKKVKPEKQMFPKESFLKLSFLSCLSCHHKSISSAFLLKYQGEPSARQLNECIRSLAGRDVPKAVFWSSPSEERTWCSEDRTPFVLISPGTANFCYCCCLS
jgi:hypothetical protein